MVRITSDLFDVTEFAHHCPEDAVSAEGTAPCVISVSVDGGEPLQYTLPKCGSRELFYRTDTLPAGEHIVSFEVLSGSLCVDGAMVF